MSLNNETSDNVTSVANKYKYLSDFEGVKKKEFERRKLLRLDQVRQQSKELSVQIRERVAREKHRQIRNIEQIKAKELLSWKEQHVNTAVDGYHYCLSNVGDAHVAAERDKELEKRNHELQQKNRDIAVMRGRKAMEKERMKHSKKNERVRKRSVSKGKKKIDKKIADKNVAHTSSHAHQNIHDESFVNDKQESDDEIADISSESPESPLSRSQINSNVFETNDDSLHMGRFSQISDLIEERRKFRNICEEMLESPARSEIETAASLAQTVNAPTSTKNTVIPAVKSPKVMASSGPTFPKRTMESAPKPLERKWAAASKSPKRTLLTAPKSPTTMIPKKSPAPVRKSMVRPRQSLEPDKSKPKNFKANSPIAPRKTAVSSRLTKSPNNTLKAVTTRGIQAREPFFRSKSSSPPRREYVPRFSTEPIGKPGILKKSSSTVITTTNATNDPIDATSKVQFYDHCNRYGKEYDAAPGIVQREHKQPTRSATEAARIQNEMDEVRFQQLEELRQKSRQRCTESLEKNQIRKDYDLLTHQLDELSKQENNLRTYAMPNEQFSEERIRQMARNRQQNLNRAFEEIQHKPVVITCQPVTTNHSSSSSDINVATSFLPNAESQRRIDPLDSSDSCTSILLGYVDNRSRKLVKDIKQYKDSNDHHKSEELVRLLARLDRLRQLLKEEIQQNASRVTTPNLESFYRSVLELDKKKNEILAHDADKENGNINHQSQQLERREQILKSQQEKLEKKTKKLFLQEQNKKRSANLAEDEIFESLTSESTTPSVDHQSEPVKILIEVKNATKVRKIRSPKKVRISYDQNVGSKTQPNVEGSSSSTVYRSPPQSYQTALTKVLSNKTIPTNQVKTKPTKKSNSTMPQTSTVQTPALVDYITRLLGMSRPSIDQLGVSSSTSIDTPSTSVVEIPGNMPNLAIDQNHLSRIEMEIDEHRRFSKEVDDSLNQSNLNQDVVRNVWMKMLKKQQEEEAKLLKNSQKKPQASRNKKGEKPKKQPVEKSPKKSSDQTEKPTQSDRIYPNDALPIQTNIPETSERRIAALTKQIEQVRQEKQKLLEKTMSSVRSSNSSSGKGFDSTEYKDFMIPAAKSNANQAVEEKNGSSQASDIISLSGHFVEEEPKNLVSTKQIGISFSRDSGIGSSRPVTSTDFRVSPDIKLSDKPLVSATVEPTTKMITDSEAPSRPPLNSNVKSTAPSDGPSRKAGKPPISLKRFSPQLDTEQLQPHDLSTINEIETSATSRLNRSTQQASSDTSISAAYNRFPTFFEYGRLKKNSSTDGSSSDKSYSDTELKNMLDVSLVTFTDLEYRKLEQPKPDDKKTDEKSISDVDDDYIDVEEEILKRNLLGTTDVTSSTTSDSKKLTSSNSSDVLARDFNQIGLNWASVMLKKTSTTLHLESSSSSFKSLSNVPVNAPNNNNSMDDRINGNPLNIRDFLKRELLKRAQSNSSSSMDDDSALTDQFIRSLLSASHSSTAQQATHRTSTPNRLMSGESDKDLHYNNVQQTRKEELNLFSGESFLSSVRGTSQSESSGGKETSE